MKLEITIDGKTWEVEVEASEPEPAPLPTFQFSGAAPVAVAAPVAAGAGATVADESKVCRSPINGLVVRVQAQPGQKIEPGDTLVVLEAMKMETNITAPGPGAVARVLVKPGDGVKSGQVLMEFE